MNKDDIKKALKFCADSNDCDDCPYDVVRSCSDRLKLDARELIAEQEKEIERLKDEDTRLTEKLKQVLLAVDTVKEMTAMCNIDKQNAEIERLKSQQREIERLKAENEQLKVKLEKNPLAIKQKIMEEDDYELTEREQATLFLDRMGSDVEILHDIVENLDELLGKGIDEYIKGIDGVEGLKDMWERSAVREFAEKLRKRLTADRVSNDNVVINANYEIDELLKEYE